MGNNMCISENQQILSSQKTNETLTVSHHGSSTPVPARVESVDRIYQQLISQRYLPYSIEKDKSRYKAINLNIFGQSGIFVGDLKDGKPHGPGQIYFYNKNFLEAIFNFGDIDSQDALMIESNGNYYRGGFKESVQTGRGILRASGSEWKGQFSSGRISGNGELKQKEGKRYLGTFQNGKMEGKGKLFYPNGDFYQGYFKQGKLSGIGCYQTSIYEYFGPFLNDMKQGKGTIFFFNGDKFEGWFERNKINGYGELHKKKGGIMKKKYQNVQPSNFLA